MHVHTGHGSAVSALPVWLTPPPFSTYLAPQEPAQGTNPAWKYSLTLALSLAGYCCDLGLQGACQCPQKRGWVPAVGY